MLFSREIYRIRGYTGGSRAFPAASSLLRLLLLLRNFSPSRVNDSRLPEQPAGLPRISEMDLASITRERNMISGESARSLVNSRARPIHACVYTVRVYTAPRLERPRVCVAFPRGMHVCSVQPPREVTTSLVIEMTLGMPGYASRPLHGDCTLRGD